MLQIKEAVIKEKRNKIDRKEDVHKTNQARLVKKAIKVIEKMKIDLKLAKRMMKKLSIKNLKEMISKLRTGSKIISLIKTKNQRINLRFANMETIAGERTNTVSFCIQIN